MTETLESSLNLSPFRYRYSVRCIAITDICIAVFMLVFFGLRLFSSNLLTDIYPRGEALMPNLFITFSIGIFCVYLLELIMGQVLLSATYKSDTELVLSRCQKWYGCSQFLNVILAIELFVLVFSIHGGTPVALSLSVIKIIFRAIANHVVKVHMWDLRARPLTFPIGINSATGPHGPPGGGGTVHGVIGGPPGSTSLIHSHHHHSHSHHQHHHHPFRPDGLVHSGLPVGMAGILPMMTYDPPPTYEEAMKDKGHMLSLLGHHNNGDVSRSEAEGTTAGSEIIESSRSAGEVHNHSHPRHEVNIVHVNNTDAPSEPSISTTTPSTTTQNHPDDPHN